MKIQKNTPETLKFQQKTTKTMKATQCFLGYEKRGLVAGNSDLVTKNEESVTR